MQTRPVVRHRSLNLGSVCAQVVGGVLTDRCINKQAINSISEISDDISIPDENNFVQPSGVAYFVADLARPLGAHRSYATILAGLVRWHLMGRGIGVEKWSRVKKGEAS